MKTFLLFFLCLLGQAAFAKTIVVTNGNDGGPGSLRNALEQAQDGDVITFSNVNVVTITSISLTINKSVTIKGSGTTLRGNFSPIMKVGTNALVRWEQINFEIPSNSFEQLAFSTQGKVIFESCTGQWQNQTTSLDNRSTIEGVDGNAGILTLPEEGGIIPSFTFTPGNPGLGDTGPINPNPNPDPNPVCVTPTISQQPNSAQTTYGGNVSFTVVGTGNVLSFRWEESSNNGINWNQLSNGGVYSGVGTETLTLLEPSVSLSGRSYRVKIIGCNSEIFSEEANLTVGKANQTITWTNPDNITFGTALGAAQLNAVLTTGDGALTYSPAAGTVLNVGTYTLRVDAASTANYNAAFRQVSITVEDVNASLTPLPTSSTSSTPGFQDFVIPADITSVTVNVQGAKGGSLRVRNTLFNTEGPAGNGGLGRRINAKFAIDPECQDALKPGGILRLIIGATPDLFVVNRTLGSSDLNIGQGGGGGSAILYQAPGSAEWKVLVVAGGGGGAAARFSSSSPNPFNGLPGLTENSNGNTGSNGLGGRSVFKIDFGGDKDPKGGQSSPIITHSGGGGGMLGDGIGECGGGRGLDAEADGGTAVLCNAGRQGGAGFGAGGSGINGGGGGGGYSGGNGGAEVGNTGIYGGGFGAGSFIGSNVELVSSQTGLDTDNGRITITTGNSALGAPGPITRPAIECEGSTDNIYSINPIPGATSYIWSATGTGWAVTAGGSTASATITIGSGVGTVSVTASNACSTSSESTTGDITPSTVPAPPSGMLAITNSTCTNGAVSGGKIEIGDLSGTGGTLEYSTDGTNWSSSLPPYDETEPQTMYARVTNSCGLSESVIVGETVQGICENPVEITKGPSDLEITYGANAIFSVEASCSGTLSYQWEVDTNNDGSFDPITLSGIYEDTDDDPATLEIKLPSVSMDGYKYRVIVSGDCLPATSESATLRVNKADQTITWENPADITYGTLLSGTQLNAKVAGSSTEGASLPGELSYTPESGTLLNASLLQDLKVEAAETANYKAASKTVQINVLKANQTITWENLADITYGTLLSGTQLHAMVAGSSTTGASAPGALSYTPSSGTLLNAGLLQDLKVDAAETDNYNAASKTVQINVNKAEQTITWANPADITYGTLLSGTQLNATVTGSSTTGASAPGELSYTPSSGTLLNAGQSQDLKVDAAETDNYNAASRTVQINVLKANQTITWSNPDDITYGTLLSGTQLNATVTGSSTIGASAPGALSYTPAAGTLLNAGPSQNLKVDAAATDNYNAASKTVPINVNKADQEITWSNPADITYGTLLSGTQLNATVAGSSTEGASLPGELSYTPSSGTLLNAGLFQDLKVDAAETDNYNPASKTVQINVNKADQEITWANPADITYGTLLSGIQLNATVAGSSTEGASLPGELSYTPSSGTLLNAGPLQDLKVDAAETANYKAANKTVQINVNKADQEINWANPADITYGTLLSGTQLNATVSGSSTTGASAPGALSYTPSSGTLLNAGPLQDLKVDAAETANYKAASKTVQINVNKADQEITWANPADITYGTLLSGTQLNATVAGSSTEGASLPGELSYTPSSGRLLNAGLLQELKVDAAATDNYNAASKTVQINVLKANQTITWENPADITYGTLLSSTQLNATVSGSSTEGASAPGALSYTPSSGTLLNAGLLQELKVDAAETDNYNPASKTVQINVNKAPTTITVEDALANCDGDKVTLTATVKTDNLDIQSEVDGEGGKVIFKVGDNEIGSIVTSTDGVFSEEITIDLSLGANYEIITEFIPNSGNLISSQTDSKLTVFEVLISSSVTPNENGNVVIFDGAASSLGLPSSTTLTATYKPQTHSGVSYKWYVRNIGGNFSLIPIATGSTYKVMASDDFVREYMVEISIDGQCVANTVFSKVVSVEASCGKAGQNKVQVCHVTPNGKRKTICVSSNAVNALINGNPGSYIGSCNILYRAEQDPELITVAWNTPFELIKGEIVKQSDKWFNSKKINMNISMEAYNSLQPGMYTLTAELERNDFYELEEPIAINVLVLDKPLALDITISNDQLARDIRSGQVIGTLSTIDPIDDIHTYSLAENEQVELNGDQLIWKGSAVSATFTVQVMSTDRAGQTISRDIMLRKELKPGEFFMYPNPASTETNIMLALDESATVAFQVYDAIGRLVIQDEVYKEGSFTHTLKLDDLAPGIYTVQLKVGNMVMTKRLIKR